MREHWRPILPPPFITGLLSIVYVLTYFIDAFLLGLLGWVPREVASIRLVLLVLAAMLYAYYRVRSFHPTYNRRYREWLCIIPWSVDQPLPQGPIHLIWVDLIIVGVLALLAYSNFSNAAPAPVIAFLIVYLALLLLTFEAQQIHIPAIALFLAPLAIYPFRNLYVAILVLVAIYVLCLWGLRQYLKDFPWNTKYWKADAVQELRKQAIRQHVIGWPFKYLNIYEAPAISVGTAFLVSLLITWWFHVLFWVTEEPGALAGLLSLFSFWLLLGRIAVYCGIYRPPISLLGRICTGRLIIPRYDRVLLAPFCILLAGTLLPFGLFIMFGLFMVFMVPAWSFEMSSFVVLFVALSMPPKLREWRLTGPHRISRHVQTLRPRPPDAREQMMAEFFSARFKAGE